MITRKQLLSFWPDVLGIGALVLPFIPGRTPLGVLSGMVFLPYKLLAVAALLAIPIALWQGLRVRRGIPRKSERVLAYAASTVAMLLPVYFTYTFVLILPWYDGPSTEKFLLGVMMGLAWILIAANALLLRHNLKTAAPAEVSAGVFLLGAYLPNATFGLFVYVPPWQVSWGIGAYFVLAACIGYVLRIISLMRHGAKAYRPEENPGVVT